MSLVDLAVTVDGSLGVQRIGRQPGSPRTTRAIVSGASTPVAMINRNAIACTHPCQVAGLPSALLPWLPAFF
jgi:hypothetical protein